ncbi:hypothetical protein D3C80_19380 [compost metagenome]
MITATEHKLGGSGQYDHEVERLAEKQCDDRNALFDFAARVACQLAHYRAPGL